MKDYINLARKVFYVLIGVFVLIVGFFVLPDPKRFLFLFAAVLAFIFLILGGVLVYLSLKSKADKKLKIFLVMTGGAAALFLTSVLLHNLFYGIMIYFFGQGYWGDGDEGFFFIIAIFVCPIVFLVGTIGSFVMLRKSKGSKMLLKGAGKQKRKKGHRV